MKKIAMDYLFNIMFKHGTIKLYEKNLEYISILFKYVGGSLS